LLPASEEAFDDQSNSSPCFSPEYQSPTLEEKDWMSLLRVLSTWRPLTALSRPYSEPTYSYSKMTCKALTTV
ncbi:Hypothetical predicted protein, partial [Pelobates cultripes]